MPAALLTHPDCGLHEMGQGHPESPQRLRSVLAALQSSGLAAKLLAREAPPAERAQLERVHEPDAPRPSAATPTSIRTRR